MASTHYYTKNKQSMDTKFPGIDVLVSYIIEHEESLQHAANILKKAIDLHRKSNADAERVLNGLIQKYLAYYQSVQVESYTKSTIRKAARGLDSYYNYFETSRIEKTFDSRGKIRSTVLEEFTYLFLKKKVDSITAEKCGANYKRIKCGAVQAYSNLYITAKNIGGFVNEPPIAGINTKNQDFTIYREMKVTVTSDSGSSTQPIQVPILAIENKTYLDKTMLEGAIATAEKLKSGNPYSTYIVVTETYAVANDVDPAYSRIDQIFVLRKCKHDKNNRRPQPISPDVLGRLVKMVEARLTDTWADVENRMQNKGEIINQLGA